MPPDKNQVLIGAFRKKRPELASMDDETVIKILQKNRPELFGQQTQPVRPTPSDNEVQAIEQLGSSLGSHINLPVSKYHFSASAEPEPLEQDQGFFAGLQDAWGKTMERIQFFKANPEKAQKIKGQATSYQFEPFLAYLDPKESDPLSKRM